MMKTWEEMLSTWSRFIFVSVGGFGRLERNLGAPNFFSQAKHISGDQFFTNKINWWNRTGMFDLCFILIISVALGRALGNLGAAELQSI